MTALSTGGKALAAAFISSGIIHLVKPRVFEGTIPKVLPWRRQLVHVSGVAEILCAAGLLHPRYRKSAGLASAGLLVAVLPANIQMAIDAQRRGTTVVKVLTLVRVPLQWPIIKIALGAAKN